MSDRDAPTLIEISEPNEESSVGGLEVSPDILTQAEPQAVEVALSLEDLVAMAMRSNPTLVQASQSVEAARGHCLQVGLWPNPSIGWEGDEIGNMGRAGRQGIIFSQPIITGGKLTLNRNVAAGQLSAARASLAAQKLRVANDVRVAMYVYLAAQLRLSYQLELLRISETSVTRIKALFNAGDATELDLLRAQVEADRVETAMEEVRADRHAAWRRITLVIGRPDLPKTPIDCSLEQPLPVLDAQELEARLLQHSPQIAQAQARLAAARSQLSRQLAERRPNIDIEGAVMYNSASEYTEATIGFAMPLMIYNRNQGNIRKARAELIVAQREIDRLRLKLSETLTDTYRDYKKASILVEHYRVRILPNAKKAMELADIGFIKGAGAVQYIDMLNSQQTYFSSSITYAEGLEKAWTAVARLEGLLLSGGLQRPE